MPTLAEKMSTPAARSRYGLRHAIGSLVLCCLGAGAAHATPSLVGIASGDAAIEFEAAAISADGRTVVGRARSASSQTAFRWSRSSGPEMLEGLSTLDPDASSQSAEDVSADGRVIVGSIGSSAFRWERSVGATRLEPLLGGTAGSAAMAVSDDARYVVGRSHTGAFGSGPPGTDPADPPFFAPVVWLDPTTPVNVMNFLGTATGVSNDGVIVGSLTDERPQGETAGFRVDVRRPMPQFLPGFGTTGNEALALTASAISADGSTLVGTTLAAPPNSTTVVPIGYVWSGETGTLNILDAAGLEPIHPPDAGASGLEQLRVHDVSADGSTVVGSIESLTGERTEAFVWTRRTGLQRLEVLLSALGVDLSGWELRDAVSVSGDGRTIVGLGRVRTGDGGRRADSFVAVIPEPNVTLLLGLGLALASRRGRAVRSP